jgi:hypothetical protein
LEVTAMAGIVRFSDSLRAAYEALSETQREIFEDGRDGSCTTGYDNDGSTGYEIFENGFRLGRQAGVSDVLVLFGDGSASFFVSDEESLLKRIAEVAEKYAEDGEEKA